MHSAIEGTEYQSCDLLHGDKVLLYADTDGQYLTQQAACDKGWIMAPDWEKFIDYFCVRRESWVRIRKSDNTFIGFLSGCHEADSDIY
jgi:hypothetical protein